MRRLLANISLALLLMGCRAPTPSMNVFAPYGSATVPAPPTGTIGGAGGYYAPPTPAGAAPSQSVPNQPAASPPPSTPGYGSISPSGAAGSSLLGMSGEPTPAAGSSEVAQASFQSGSTAENAASTLRIKGMPVSDATSAAEPQQFAPASTPINIADLPPAGTPATSQTPSFLRILNSRSTASTPTQANPTTPPPSTGTWQTR